MSRIVAVGNCRIRMDGGYAILGGPNGTRVADGFCFTHRSYECLQRLHDTPGPFPAPPLR
jgi:hypothetical protein